MSNWKDGGKLAVSKGGANPPKKKTRSTSTKAKEDLKKLYCRKCTQMKTATQFYEATNPFIDTNGKMSICKDCSADIYEHHYHKSRDERVALYNTCRDLDVIYTEQCAQAAISQTKRMVENGASGDRMFGYYKSKVSSFVKTQKGGVEDFTFQYSDPNPYVYTEENADGEEVIVYLDDAEMNLKWGKGTMDEYIFLERELANYKKTVKCDNYTEEVLLKRICKKSLEIRKDEEKGMDVGKKEKELQDLMKTCSIDPAKANVADGGKSLDTYGLS